MKPLSNAVGEKDVGSNGVPESILLDREERELVKKGDDVTKQEMWDLLEHKRFERLKEGTVNL